MKDRKVLVALIFGFFVTGVAVGITVCVLSNNGIDSTVNSKPATSEVKVESTRTNQKLEHRQESAGVRLSKCAEPLVIEDKVSLINSNNYPVLVRKVNRLNYAGGEHTKAVDIIESRQVLEIGQLNDNFGFYILFTSLALLRAYMQNMRYYTMYGKSHKKVT